MMCMASIRKHTPRRQWPCMLPLMASLLFLAACQAEKPEPPKPTRGQEAMARFAEYCKQSGETIKRTDKDVEGLLLLKVRDKRNRSEQYRMSDIYGSTSDLGAEGESYIMTFLYGIDEQGNTTQKTTRGGYRYVDVIDPQDGVRYRYTGARRMVKHKPTDIKADADGYITTERFVLDRVVAPASPLPRYAVTFNELSTKVDRDLWIAGSSLQVIDLQTNEVIAERIGYLVDPGQGATAGNRSPWSMASYHACPELNIAGTGTNAMLRTRGFVESVLQPIQDQ